MTSIVRALRRARCWLEIHRPLVRGADEGLVYVCADCGRLVAGRMFCERE